MKKTGGQSPKKASPKNAQHFPLLSNKHQRHRGCSGEDFFLALLCIIIYLGSVMQSNSVACLEGKKKKRKKNLGRGQNVQCEKGPVRGQRKSPLPGQKALDAVRPWVPVTHWLTKKAVKIPQKEGTNPPRSRRFPWPSLGRGGGRDHPRPASARSRGGPF